MARLHRDPTMPASLPSGWAPVLGAMTAREAAARPEAEEVVRAFNALSTGQTTTVIRPPSPRTATLAQPVVASAPFRSSRRGVWVVASALAVVALFAIGFALANQSSPAPKRIAPVSNDVPNPLRTDVKNFVHAVQTP
jgi:hypothetical protein